MTNPYSARGPRGLRDAALTAKRQAGTTLVEILVVIVIFLIGILAVVQIFPRGFQLLLTTRNNSMATALGREAVERLKGSPELIPDEIVPVTYVNGVPTVNPTVNPLGLAPLGDAVDASGDLTQGGTTVTTDWNLEAGPNIARHIIGEGHRLPAPRELGAPTSDPTTQYENYGGLLVLDHNPVDPGPNATTKPNILAYGNDLSRTEGGPRETAPDGGSAAAASLANYTTSGSGATVMSADGSTVVASIPALAATTPVSIVSFGFYTVNSDSNGASLLLPALSVDRTYRIRLSAYVGTGAGVSRVDYTALSVFVPRINPAAQTPPQLVEIAVSDVLNAYGLLNGQSLYAVEADSIRVAPQYRRVATWSTATSLGLSGSAAPYAPVDPFEMKVMDPYLGTLLFSPAARNGIVSRPGGVSEPLFARVDYDVRDWRVIGEDFRLTNNDVLPGRDHTFSLSLQSLKVGSSTGPDGLTNGGIFTANRSALTSVEPSYDPTPSPRDNVVIVDLTTGYEVQRYRTTTQDNAGRTYADAAAPATNSNGPDILVSVDKSRGSITFHDAIVGNTDASGIDPLDVVLIPPTGNPITVNAANRTFRVLYRARQEWAVQTLKGASQYTLVSSLPSAANFAPDAAYVDMTATQPTRIYFAPSQVGSKVTIDRIDYQDSSGQHVLEGQDFVILPPAPTGSISLPYIDVISLIGSSAQLSTAYAGAPVQGIKGASVSVRVLWNPDAFTLSTSTDPTVNLTRIDQYDRGWRKSTTQTYLRAEETR